MPLRKLVPVFAAVVVLLVASFVSPVGALAAGPRGHGGPGSDSGAWTSTAHASSESLSVARPRTALAPLVYCSGGFGAVASANAAGNNFLVSSSAVNVNDVWAAGIWTNAGGYDQTLVEHFDGTTWSIVPSPNPGPFHNDLNGAFAVSSNDVWFVGSYTNDAGNTTLNSFALHWNGASFSWYLIKPYLTNILSELVAVTATSGTDVWAVGNYNSAGWLPYGAHWDGMSWTPTLIPYSPPGNGSDSQLTAVSAWSPTDVWAVGEFNAGAGRKSWAVHFNGATWSTVTTPNTAAGVNEIFGVSALEAGHAVGVGMGNYVSGTLYRQSEAWDLVTTGSSTITSLGGSIGSGDNVLLGVTRSGGGLQAVGYFRISPTGARQTLAIPAAWDAGTHTLTWSPPASSASPGAVDDVLYSAAALSPQAFWATGYRSDVANSAQTLTELYCEHAAFSATPPIYAGVPFSLTVLAQSNYSKDAGFRGTFHFASSDSQAVLPADYAFTSADAGMHVFSGVVLNMSGTVTITATDPATSFVSGVASFTVTCQGACQGPGGTAGARDAMAGTAGISGARDASQSAGSSPPPRLPTLRAKALSGDAASGLTAAVAAALAAAPAPVSTQQPPAQKITAEPAGGVATILEPEPVLAPGARSGDMIAASRRLVVERRGNQDYLPLVLAALALFSMALAVFRTRKNRRLIGHSRP